MNKILNYLEDDNWYKIFDAENEEDIEYKLLEREEVQILLKEIERLNNIINGIENWLKAKDQFNFQTFYIQDAIDKLQELKGSDKE